MKKEQTITDNLILKIKKLTKQNEQLNTELSLLKGKLNDKNSKKIKDTPVSFYLNDKITRRCKTLYRKT